MKVKNKSSKVDILNIDITSVKYKIITFVSISFLTFIFGGFFGEVIFFTDEGSNSLFLDLTEFLIALSYISLFMFLYLSKNTFEYAMEWRKEKIYAILFVLYLAFIGFNLYFYT